MCFRSVKVVALKRKYEEGMAASSAAAAPKKGPPSPRGGPSHPNFSSAGPNTTPGAKKSAFGAKNTASTPASPPKVPAPIAVAPVAAQPAAIAPTADQAPVAAPVEPATAPAPSASLEASSPVPERPTTPEVKIIPANGENADTSETGTSDASRSLTDSPSGKQLDPSKKEAMKKALEDMVLPARKKASPPPPPKPAPSSAADTAPSVDTKKEGGRKELKLKSKSDVSAASSNVVSGAAPTSAPDAPAPIEGEGSVSQSEDSARNKGNSASDLGTAGTSDDEVSSDEEEYLRGVEERRQRAAAEKAERAKAAKDAREARQNMYAFLTHDPPPGFVTPPKQTASTSAAGKSKTKKEKKDKAKDKTSSSKAVTVTGSLNSSGNGSNDDEVSGRKKASGANTSTSGGNGVHDAGLTPASRYSSELDLSSSPVPHDNPLSSSQASLNVNDGSFTTRYRPVTAIDSSTWKRAEEAIMKEATVTKPPRRRWEEYQANYAAKRDAAEAAADAAHKSKDAPKKQYSTTNLKAGLKTNLQLKGLRATRDRRPSHGQFDTGSTDSPGRRRTITDRQDEGSYAPMDSPRRKSNADDSSDSNGQAPSNNGSSPSTPVKDRTDSPQLSRKPLPKLERVDDPRAFLFEAPIADTNFRFMERNGEELIAGGTIEKLIQILTSSSDSNPEYFQCFMLTYHNFLTPQKLIDLLRVRWNSQPSDPSKLDLFVSKHLHSIRLRIVNVLRMWIEKFGTDFKDENVVQALNEFVDYIRLEYPQMADLVSSKLNKYLGGYIFDTEGEVDEEPPETYAVTEGKEANPSLTDIHPEEFARQMALVEHALFKAIPYKELLTNASAGKQNPNVSNMISYTNHLVNWIGTQIVKPDDIKLRAVALARFITIAKYCIISCQNYNGAMEILSALRSAPVFRLKHTWNRLPDAVWDDYEWLENIFESDNNYATYRAALTNAVPPCVPYLGRYLSEILFLNELHPDYLDGTASGPSPIINFAKMTYVADILLHLQRYQKSPFCLTGAPAIQKFFLLKRGVMGDKDLYKLSLEREPREPSGSLSNTDN